MKKDFLEIGKIVNTHGVRGELKVEPWCDSPEVLEQCKTLFLDEHGEQPRAVRGVRTHGRMALVFLEEVTGLEQAERLKNRILYCRREDLPLEPGAYFLEDLLGCRILDEKTGKELGTVREVSNFGASDVWHIRRQDGPDVLIPNIPDVVRELRLEDGYVTICKMKGLFEDED